MSSIKLFTILGGSLVLNIYLLYNLGLKNKNIDNLKKEIDNKQEFQFESKIFESKKKLVNTTFDINYLKLSSIKNDDYNIDFMDICKSHNNINCLNFKKNNYILVGDSDNEKNISFDYY